MPVHWEDIRAGACCVTRAEDIDALQAEDAERDMVDGPEERVGRGGTGLNWGSPGFGVGHATTYGESTPAIGFAIAFDTGGTDIINPSPGSATCPTGDIGTIFCAGSVGGLPTTQWTASSPSAGSIEFLAPGGTSPSMGQFYFVQIFFNSEGSENFTGAWVTGVPEPGSLALFSAGVVGLGLLRLRKSS